MTAPTLIRHERFGRLTAVVIAIQTAQEFSVFFQIYEGDELPGALLETFVSKTEHSAIIRFDAWVEDQQNSIDIAERKKILDKHAKPGVTINDVQGESLYKKYRQDADGALSFAEFVSRVDDYGDYLGIQWCGMFLGIETDGYTHS